MKLVKPAALLAAALIAGSAGCIATSDSALAQATVKKAAQEKTTGKVHKVGIQVNQNDKAVMNLALNNAMNITEFYKEKGEQVQIEIVTYGPGLHMLRSESPVKDR